MSPARKHTRLRALLAAAAVAIALPGCAFLKPMFGPKVRECEGFDVPLSVFVGPSRKELRTRVLSSGVDETFAFVAEANADALVVVGFTPLGTKSFTLTRKADDVEVANLIGSALKVPPRNVMEDVLAMSVPSECATFPEGPAPSNFDSWVVTDTCSNGRPLKRLITKSGAGGALEVEVEYRQDAIVVRQKRCKYIATYVLQASVPVPVAQPAPAAAPAASAPAAAPSASATPAAPPAAPSAVPATPDAPATPPAAAPAAASPPPANAAPAAPPANAIPGPPPATR